MDGRTMKASSARVAALEVVTRVREREAYAHETLDAVLGQAKLDPREAGLATRIAYGTVATRGTLDEAVLRYVTDPARLEPRVGDALALTAYQLLFMRIPAHAAVSEGVELVRSHRQSAAGLANAVLRRLAADSVDFPWGDPVNDIAALARQYGHPQWLVELLVAELGRGIATQVMAANNEPAPLYLAHVPTARPMAEVMDILTRDGARPELCPLPGCIVVQDASTARRSKAVTDRDVLVMDAGAQFAVAALLQFAGDTVVEVGAGRGSKSLLAASRLRSDGASPRVLAVDLHDFKLEALQRAAASMGLDGIETIVVDASAGGLQTVIEEVSADSVLVDAPCSGLGTLRRHPDRRWRANPREIEVLADLGGRLLEQSSRLVRPGGFVVYSTCTLARRENEDVIEGFLASDAGAGFAWDSLASLAPPEWDSFIQADGWFRSLPEPGGPDGHFVARLKRE